MGLEFERLRFPISIRCQALDCARERGAIKRPPTAFWREKTTGLVFCTEDRDRVDRDESFIGTTLDKIGAPGSSRPRRKLTPTKADVAACETGRSGECPLHGTVYCPCAVVEERRAAAGEEESA